MALLTRLPSDTAVVQLTERFRKVVPRNYRPSANEGSFVRALQSQARAGCWNGGEK